VSPVAAMHPPRHSPAPRADRLVAAGPGLHVHRPAHNVDPLDRQTGQMGNQDSDSLKIARPP
jgi:hypothetical protein